jgi:hypothetical protein
MSSGWAKFFKRWEMGDGRWGRKRLFSFPAPISPLFRLLSPLSVECFRFWLIYTFVGVGTKVVTLSLSEVLG